MEVIGSKAVTSGRLINRSHRYNRRDGQGDRRPWVTTMRHAGTRPSVRRMQAIDQALRARKWLTDKTLARDLEVDPHQAASRYLQADLRVRRQAEPVENGLKDGQHYRSAVGA